MMLTKKNLKGVGAFRAILFMPTILSSAVMALVFYLLFNAYNGEINKYLMTLNIIDQPINWLSAKNAMKVIVITSVWGGIGNYMIYFIAGLQGISNEVYESADIEGANFTQKLFCITIPMLGPVLKMIMMIAIVTAFQDMSSIMVMTEGGPINSTMVMFLYAYQFFFPISPGSLVSTQFGYGASVSFVSACIVGIITIAFLRFSRKLDEIY
jgi:ABC-type sugar transport system permease subunit